MSPWDERLGRRFITSFPDRPPGLRTLGREAEHPVVHADGTAADIAVLWPHLAAGGGELLREGDLIVGLACEGCTFSAEVGFGTMEIIVGPCDDLHQIRGAYEAARDRLLAAAEAEGLRVLGYGIQPVTPPSFDLMTPKQRYAVLRATLGDLWAWFTATASDQTHVSVSRREVIDATNTVNLLSPLVIALCANSPVWAGADGGVCCGREHAMGAIGLAEHRHGMPGAPVNDAEEWVARTFPMPLYMVKGPEGSVADGRRFADWLQQVNPDEDLAWQTWLHHEHYIWNSARPRTLHGTLELRAPCQQPGDAHMAGSALALGLVEGHREIQRFIDKSLGDDQWPALRAWHRLAVRHGASWDAPIDGFVEGVLERAVQAVARRERGEEALLQPLLDRWQKRKAPAQVAREAFAQGGVLALVDAVALR